MGLLDDTAIFATIIQQGGFSHAAKYLNLSNGMISRRIAQLEAKLGVTLIKRTTRQITLTPEGEVFWQHAQRIQQELDAALTIMQASANKPKGIIRISAPVYFGTHYLTPIIMKFLNEFEGIKIDLILNNQMVDPIKEKIDIAIRSTGYSNKSQLKDSSLHQKFLFREKISLYASAGYIQKQGAPADANDLANHTTICYSDGSHLQDKATWHYSIKNKNESVTLTPKFNCNDIESSLIACASGYGIGRFTDLHIKSFAEKHLLKPILTDYNWGEFQLVAVYSHQQALPKRSRLLLEFIGNQLKNV
jgi:LysR family transcriptional activator of dmlA